MNEVGVVLAGGTGSRLLPLTRTVNKHLLPVNGRPMLHWPLRTLAQMGLDHAIVVLGGRSCGEVVEQFGTRYDTGEGVLNLVYVYQEGAGGIPAALAQAYPALDAMGAKRAVVVLGDNVFPSLPTGLREVFEDQDALNAYGGAIAIAKRVPDSTSYGCVAVNARGRPDFLAGLVEKPKDPPPAGFVWAALLGLYVLPFAHLRQILDGLVPSARGELEIPDVLAAYQGRALLRVVTIADPWIDAGDPPGYWLANSPGFWTEASVNEGLAQVARRGDR
jgi:glucose-1-phosphate thymidylyltransferase